MKRPICSTCDDRGEVSALSGPVPCPRCTPKDPKTEAGLLAVAKVEDAVRPVLAAAAAGEAARKETETILAERKSAACAPMKHLDPLPLEEALKLAPPSLHVQFWPNGHPGPNVEPVREAVEYFLPSGDLGLRAIKLLIRLNAFMQDDGAGECGECGAVAREDQSGDSGPAHDVEGDRPDDDDGVSLEYMEVPTVLVHEEGCEWAAIVKAARERGL